MAKWSLTHETNRNYTSLSWQLSNAGDVDLSAYTLINNKYSDWFTKTGEIKYKMLLRKLQ